MRRARPSPPAELIALVHAAFAHRRKALAGSLALVPGAPDDIRDATRAALERDRPAGRTRAPSGCAGRLAAPRRRHRARAPDGPATAMSTPAADPTPGAVVHERAYAKLNLVLHVGRPRADGMHPLCSIFASIDLHDDVGSSRRPERGRRVECPGVDGPNLAEAALARFRERVPALPPLQVAIEKRIPVAAGLGGGSADAAAVLRAANRIAGNPLDADALRELARRARLRRAQPDRAAPRAGDRHGRDRRADRAAAVRRRARAAGRGPLGGGRLRRVRPPRRRPRRRSTRALCASWPQRHAARRRCSRTTSSRPRSRCGPSSTDVLDALRARRRARGARQRLRPDLLRPLRATARPPRRPRPRARSPAALRRRAAR